MRRIRHAGPLRRDAGPSSATEGMRPPKLHPFIDETCIHACRCGQFFQELTDERLEAALQTAATCFET